jgi:DNA (cytosine-5)-methyltransferase 1
VILSGPPCQGFSAAGSRNPKDRRNKVLVAVAHAIAELQPACALIENVSMVLAEKHGERLEKFEEVLAAGGFRVARAVLDASEFGVSQRRKRAFFFITRKALGEADILNRLACYKMPAKGVEEALRGLPTPLVRPNDYCDEADINGVSNHLAMRHSQAVMDKIAAIPPGTGPMSYRRLHPTRPSNTLFSGHRAAPAHFSEPRSITVREAARLQGFPDEFRIYGSFANQMEQVTNAVPPPLARAVLTVLLELAHIPCRPNA